MKIWNCIYLLNIWLQGSEKTRVRISCEWLWRYLRVDFSRFQVLSTFRFVSWRKIYFQILLFAYFYVFALPFLLPFSSSSGKMRRRIYFYWELRHQKKRAQRKCVRLKTKEKKNCFTGELFPHENSIWALWNVRVRVSSEEKFSLTSKIARNLRKSLVVEWMAQDQLISYQNVNNKTLTHTERNSTNPSQILRGDSTYQTSSINDRGRHSNSTSRQERKPPEKCRSSGETNKRNRDDGRRKANVKKLDLERACT